MAVGRLVETLEQRLAPHTDEWFPERPHSGLELRVLADRPSCVLLTVHLDGATAPAALVKVRRDPGGAPVGGGRPRLRQEAANAAELTLLEWSGLVAIERACEDVPGMGVVRPLLLMPDEAALAMTFVEAPTLRTTVLGLSRLRWGSGDLDEAVTGCTLAGRWLRTFQEHSSDTGRPVRQGTRDDVVDRLRAYGDYLDSRAWRRVATAGAALVTRLLPPDLPLAVGHGDFAPRNMLLRGGRLTVIDPLPRWQVPTYDDLCRFLVGLRLIGEQVHSHGFAFPSGTLDALEDAAVTAYVGPDGDRSALRAYQLLILMDKWTAMIDNPRAGMTGRLARRSAALADRRVRREAEHLLDLAGAQN